MIPRRRHNGHTLAGALVGLVMMMLMWVALYRHTTGFLRMEKACVLRKDRATSSTRAMAWALTLLETGKPPGGGDYQCRVVVAAGAGGTYVVTYIKSSENTYTVSVYPATVDDASLPLAPETF